MRTADAFERAWGVDTYTLFYKEQVGSVHSRIRGLLTVDVSTSYDDVSCRLAGMQLKLKAVHESRNVYLTL